MSALPKTLITEPWDVADDLSRFLYGRDLTAHELGELSALAHYEDYAAGSVILDQGAVNTCLFFLVEGSVSIVKDGETIATLKKPGDLLGEMSLITKNHCSAASIAETETQLLVLEIERTTELPLGSQVTLSHALYRLYSVILAEKLAVTNEKARLFEVTNRELQIAKNALEAASSNRIDELSSNQRLVFKKLGSVIQDEISPIGARLSQLRADGSGSAEEIATLATQMERILKDFEPLTKTFDTDHLLHSKRVLLLEGDIDEQINAKMSLAGTGVEFNVLSDMAAAKQSLQETKPDIVCVNGNFTELIPFVRETHPDTKLVFVTSESIAEHFGTLRKYPDLSAILARHPDDRTFTVKNTATTIRKLLSQDIFGMEKYLNWGTDVISHTVTGSEQRPELVSRLEDFVDSIGIRGPLKRKCTRVAEELLMNAIYDAPTDAKGKHIYNHHDRGVELLLKPEERATFRYACDGTFIAISVVDRFGGLTRSIILDYLERCFGGGVGGNVAGKGGGGNGLFQIIQSSSLTAFNVRPGVQTEVIALLNLNIQLEKIGTHPSFHFFEYGR